MSVRASVRSLVGAATCGLAVVIATALPSQQLPAQAADLRAFDPGYIISDALFYDSGAMSAPGIQSFLDQKGSSCAASSGRTCLKDFQQGTGTRPSDTRCTGTYAGASNETAAQIIAKVAVACGINPQVLLVMLQKEQGLVTASAGGRTDVGYRSAMGYGCPDTSACDASYYGFFNQVYSAAHQFQNYANAPTNYGHRAGMVNQLPYSPDAACGTSGVLIQNQATASLYNYTPYQPNAAALAAGYGSGDSCSAYGNRNFWSYFTDWFGPTTQRAPVGWLDSATSTSPGVLSVSGWAVDPDTTASITVHVYVDGTATAALAAADLRPDVGSLFRRGDNHGFNGTVRATGGTHQVCIYAIDSAGGNNAGIGCLSVTVLNQAPVGWLDSATSTSPGVISVSGWAVDPDTTASIKVHVYLDGVGVRALAANGSRPDVGRSFGMGDNHGFSGTVRATGGTHQVCVYAIDSAGGNNPRIGCSSVTVLNQAPLGWLDAVTSTAGRITVGGWAVDPDTTASIKVHVYLDGVGVQALTANGSRRDVGRIFGMGDNHGFSGTVKAFAGTHQVCVYAIDSAGGNNPRIGCSSVTVLNQAPLGWLDAVTSTAGRITVGGWAVDPDTTASIKVHVYLDGVGVQALTANGSRRDVGRIFGMGDNHGFSGTVRASAGIHQLCVYAIDSWQGTNPLIACRSVSVH